MKEEDSSNEFIPLPNYLSLLLARLEQEACHEPKYRLDVAVRLFRFLITDDVKMQSGQKSGTDVHNKV